MSIILGLDGGGSKTFAAVVNEKGDLLGTGVSGHGNYQYESVGIQGALQNYRSAIDDALRTAGLDIHDVDFAQFGLAGADRPKDFSILRPAVESLGFRNWDIVCDTYEGLRTGSADNMGVVLVCGSGTNSAGRNPSGQTIQIGGFGYLFGDTAGGNHLAQEAFRAACRDCEKRGPKTKLSELIPNYYGMTTMAQVMAYYWDNDKYDTELKMCELLHEAAAAGDDVSIEILHTVGTELGIAANAVLEHLGGFEGLQIPVVLVGSVIQKGRSPVLIGAIEAEIAKKHEAFHLIIPEMAPVYGSVLLAFDHLGCVAGPEIEQKFISYGGYQK